MDQDNTATPDELQQAINSITNPGGTTSDPVADLTAAADTSTVDLGTPPAPEVPDLGGLTTPPMPEPVAAPEETETPAAPVAPALVEEAPVAAPTTAPATAPATSGDADLDRVKSAALSDLKPIVDKIEATPDKKFKIYKEIIESTNDKTCIEPAYNIAKTLTDEQAKADALLYIVEEIDKLGGAAA